MKKITKLSLATAIAITGLSSSVYAAETISEAFTNGKVKGTVKSYYFAQDFDGTGKEDSSIWVNGGSLNYITDSYRGIVLGSTFQTSHVATVDDDDSKTAGTLDASGSVLSEVYLEYTYDKTTFKGGRQFVATPLIFGSGSRLIRESFEAYLLSNTNIPDTKIVAGVVTKYQTRTDGAGDVGNFEKIGSDGIRTIYVKNTSIPNLTIQAQYADFVDTAVDIYADAKYNFGPVYIAAQVFNTNYDTNTDEDSSLYGLKIGGKVSGLDLFAGYTTTDEDGNVHRGIGQAAYSQFTTTTKTAGIDAFAAGADSWQVGAGYKIGELKTKLRYTNFDLEAEDADLDETTLNLEYKITKALTAQVDYSILDYEDNDRDATDLRTRLIYSF